MRVHGLLWWDAESKDTAYMLCGRGLTFDAELNIVQRGHDFVGGGRPPQPLTSSEFAQVTCALCREVFVPTEQRFAWRVRELVKA